MAHPTAQQVLDLARSHLGDEAVSGGEIYTNPILLPFLNTAWREVYRVMSSLQLPRVKTYAYYNLPANTGTLYPATASITDMHEVESVATRSVAGTYTITGCVLPGGIPTLELDAGTPWFVWGVDLFGVPALTTTIVPDNTAVVVWGVGGVTGVSDSWIVTRVDDTHIVLNGAVATGVYTGGGFVSISNEQFVDLAWVDDVGVVNAADEAPSQVAWIGGAFHFKPSTEVRQLRISYWSSAPAITTVNDVIGVDDSIDYLAARTAGMAAFSRGGLTDAEGLALRSLGPTGQADASGGLLRQLFCNAVLREQAEQPIRRRPYRGKRTAYPLVY